MPAFQDQHVLKAAFSDSKEELLISGKAGELLMAPVVGYGARNPGHLPDLVRDTLGREMHGLSAGDWSFAVPLPNHMAFRHGCYKTLCKGGGINVQMLRNAPDFSEGLVEHD
eukprot:TRINITY_DN14807_c0_g1_i2.p2 TRINITY_DN14807_c0_g1~~TRINITY_DN14807_c0_g1_i2.p2  ORF type:complete len:112 (-),score=19.85 TRINITY_DN14807_c0_g1_i2:263-598(-)